MTTETLGALLRETRLRHGWTLRDTAKAAGITATFLCDLEYDRRGPSAETLTRLGSVLQLDEAFLAYRAGLMPPVRCWEGTLPPEVFNVAWNQFLLAVKLSVPAPTEGTKASGGLHLLREAGSGDD